MGKHEDWRDLLLALFPECFRQNLPSETHFDMCIVDMMQFMARMRSEATFRPKDICHHAVRAAFDYSNVENSPIRPIIDKAVVLLIDTPKNTPKCKASTQMARDTISVVTHIKGDDDDEAEKETAVEEDDDRDGTIMTEDTYNALIKEMDLSYGDYMIHAEMKQVPARMTPTMVWRSNNLKWQLNSMIVSSLLKNVTVPRGRVLIIDDGVVFGDPQAYPRLRNRIIEEYAFHDRSEYEKELLVSFLISQTLNMRYVLHHDGKYKRMPESGIGEADLKFGNYITRESEAVKNPMRRYIVVSQDTDIPFILLAHMRRLINPETGRIDDDIEVWIDSQTPSDKARGHNRAYRFINVKRLYYAIIDFFRVEYPSVSNPIETLLFMVNALDTDFTNRLGHKCLGITRRLVWNVFSETHYKATTPEDLGYVVFGKKKDRSKTHHYSPKAYNLLAGDAISVVYNEESNEYRIVLDMARCELFLYLLCQITPVADMTKLKMLNATKPSFYYADPDVFLIQVADLMRTIETNRNEQSTTQNNSVQTLLMGKSFILPQKNTQQQQPSQKSAIGPAIRFTPTDTHRYYDKTVMSKLVNKEIPAMYGIPSRAQMRARLCRLDWVLNYIQNGTVTRDFAASCYTPHRLDPERSRFGWHNKPLETSGPNLVNINSSYHTQSLTQVLLGEMPIRVHATVECDEL